MKALKWIGIVLIAALIIVGGILFFRKQNANQKADDDFYAQYTDKAGNIQKIKVNRATGSILINGLLPFENVIQVGTFPLTRQTDETKFTAKDRAYWGGFIKDTLIPMFGQYVDYASQLTKVPKWLIYGIMVTEIDKNDLAKSISGSGARGAMQLMSITATDTIVVAKKLKNYDAVAHGAIIKNALGANRAEKVFTAIDTYDRALVEIGKSGYRNDLFNPELNIHISAMKLANLLTIYGENNLPSIVAAYNKGDATPKLVYKIVDLNIEQAIAKTSGEVNGYIKRTCGLHGSFDIITNDLGILD